MGLGNSGRISQRRGRWKEFVEAPNAVRHHGEEKEEAVNVFCIATAQHQAFLSYTQSSSTASLSVLQI
jgi:heme oxygenase